MKQLDDYIKAEKEVFKCFGFSEDQGTYPINDNRNYFWFRNNDEIIFYDTKEAFDSDNGMHKYSEDVLEEFKQQDYTMFIIWDDNGTKHCSIFDNSKQMPAKYEE